MGLVTQKPLAARKSQAMCFISSKKLQERQVNEDLLPSAQAMLQIYWGEEAAAVCEADTLGNNNVTFLPLMSCRIGFYQNDHLGTPQKLTTSNGATAWSARYTSFGEAMVDGSSTITSNLRFPGQYWDKEVLLSYHYLGSSILNNEIGPNYSGFKYYDPLIGRYIERSPKGDKIKLLTFNLYDINQYTFFNGFFQLSDISENAVNGM